MKQFEEELEEFDIIIHNIFDFDVENVIKDCVELFSNNLFSSHLMDILYLNGKSPIRRFVSLDSATRPSVRLFCLLGLLLFCFVLFNSVDFTWIISV